MAPDQPRRNVPGDLTAPLYLPPHVNNYGENTIVISSEHPGSADFMSASSVVAEFQPLGSETSRFPETHQLVDPGFDQVSDKPEEACGVFGIYAPGEEVSKLIYFGLFALQHRGQESAGIATFQGDTVSFHKGMGLVSQVFSESILTLLPGPLGVEISPSPQWQFGEHRTTGCRIATASL
jgi:hypothetical protein